MPDPTTLANRSKLRDRAALAILLIYWGALVLGTHLPTTGDQPGLPMSDKLLHFGAYGGLAALAYYWLRGRGISWVRAVIMLWSALAVHAILDEITQGAVPGRSPDPRDAIADLLGVTLALVLWRTWEIFRSRFTASEAAVRIPG